MWEVSSGRWVWRMFWDVCGEEGRWVSRSVRRDAREEISLLEGLGEEEGER